MAGGEGRGVTEGAGEFAVGFKVSNITVVCLGSSVGVVARGGGVE